MEKREKVQEWLCKEMRKARVALGHAESRPGVTDEELTNLSNKIAAIDWLLEMMGCSSGSRWISVKEKLPEDDVRVLVCSNNGDESHIIAITHYTHRKYGYNIEGWVEPWQYFFFDHKITHWTNLPEPPKEE